MKILDDFFPDGRSMLCCYVPVKKPKLPLGTFTSVHSHIKINFTMEKTRRGTAKISFMSKAFVSEPHPSLQLHLINLTKVSVIVSQRNRNIKLRLFDYCCSTPGIYTFRLTFGLELREKLS